MTTQPAEQERRIVVGVDGSEASKAALEWAVRQAGLTGAAVEALIAWEFPVITGYPVPVSGVDWEDLAGQIITDAVAEVRGVAGQVQIRSMVMKGNAAQVLLDESAGRSCWLSVAADMVGSPRRCLVRLASIAFSTRRARS
jgi:nucleotide-binding universal stress UspA family protein